MNIFNYSIVKQKKPDQNKLGRTSSSIGINNRFGLGFNVEEFNLFSQIKDYRTDLLNGTAWTAVDPINNARYEYINFIKLLNSYSTAIFNDYITIGRAVFAKIEGQIYYISSKNYTKTEDSVSIHGYKDAEAFEFNEPNAFCGEFTIFKKCESYQKLYNIALSCQKNGMSKSGFVSVISPKSNSAMPVEGKLTDEEKKQMEINISNNHGIANDEQRNFLILNKEVDLKTISYDFSKLGILETKKLCEEYVCSKLGVPHILLPSSGQTFANYQEANKILYENHSKYCEYFINFVGDFLKLNITYKTIAEAGKGII